MFTKILFPARHGICFVHLVVYYFYVYIVSYSFVFLVQLSFVLIICTFSLTIIFNLICFLAHGKKDFYSLHETTVVSRYTLDQYYLLYIMCAYFAEIYFIHSFIPLIQDIEPSNSRDRLSHATLTFFSLAEQCHTHQK